MKPVHGNMVLQAKVHKERTSVESPMETWKPVHSIVTNRSWLSERSLLKEVSVLDEFLPRDCLGRVVTRDVCI